MCPLMAISNARLVETTQCKIHMKMDRVYFRWNSVDESYLTILSPFSRL